MSDLVVINAADYKIEESKAKEISGQFKPMLDKMEELEKEYNEIVQLPIEDFSTSLKAKDLRLRYVKVRTGTAEIHKKQKEFYLAGGRFVDGWKNAQIFASQGIEDKLLSIEKYQENLEKERIEAVKKEREELLKPYGVQNTEMLNLGTMDDSIWNNFISGTKLNFENQKKAELQAAKDKEKADKIAILEKDRFAEIAPYMEFDTVSRSFGTMTVKDYGELLQSLKMAKSSYDKRQKEIALENERLKKEREEKEGEAKKEQDLINLAVERQNKLRELDCLIDFAMAKEMSESEFDSFYREKKQAAEERKKIEAEYEKRRLKEEAEAKKAAKAPIKKKLERWVNDFSISEAPTVNEVTKGIEYKFAAFKACASQQIENI